MLSVLDWASLPAKQLNAVTSLGDQGRQPDNLGLEN